MRGRSWIAISVAFIAACSRADAPEVALARFYANQEPECTLKFPLYAGTPGVIPLVIQAIRDPQMPKRRYAISYLGEVGAVDATGELLVILENDSEQDYFRADALEALQAIDPDRARKLAPRYVGGPGLLGVFAKDITSGRVIGQRKTAWDRFWERPCG